MEAKLEERFKAAGFTSDELSIVMNTYFEAEGKIQELMLFQLELLLHSETIKQELWND